LTPNAPGAPRQKEPIMTTENIFSAVLTLSLLAGGAIAFGSDAASKHVGKANAETIAVTLPTVTVVGRRAPTEIAIESETVEHRVQ
jgi:hypothetical protein